MKEKKKEELSGGNSPIAFPYLTKRTKATQAELEREADIFHDPRRTNLGRYAAQIRPVRYDEEE